MFHVLLQVLVLVAVVTADTGEYLILNDGNRIPVLSLGTFGRIPDIPILVKPAVVRAIEAGFRQIDTAAIYLNEEQVGEAIQDVISRGVVTREELFITTKIQPTILTREGVLPALQESLRKLKLDYVDLYLIHRPNNQTNATHDYLNVWKGLEDIKKLNLAKSIGVSNFFPFQLNRVIENSDTVPAVNQIEVHPLYADFELVEFCQSLNITVQSYAPFGYMVRRPWLEKQTFSTFEEPILRQLARKYGKIPSQIVLRYLIDRGTIPVPKSTNLLHIDINVDVFDFKLTPEEVNAINALNRDALVYTFTPETLKAFNEYFGLN